MRHVGTALLSILCWASTALAQFVGPGGTIPAVANLPGLKGTLWRSDVYVVNINPTDTSVQLLLQPEIVDGEPAFEPQVSDPIQIPANAQLTMANVVQSRFGLINTKGALTIFSLDGLPLAIGSRTYNVPVEGGSFGQDVRGVLVKNTAWTPGLRHDSLFRSNIGVYLPVDPGPPATFTVRVFRADGSELSSGSIIFRQAGLIQRSLTTFGVDRLLDGYVVITCSDPTLVWFGYASRADQVTGDAVYRAAVALQSDVES